MDLHCNCRCHQVSLSVILQKYFSVEPKDPTICEWWHNCSWSSLHHHAFYTSISVRSGSSFLGYVSQRLLYQGLFCVLLFWFRQHLQRHLCFDGANTSSLGSTTRTSTKAESHLGFWTRFNVCTFFQRVN